MDRKRYNLLLTNPASNPRFRRRSLLAAACALGLLALACWHPRAGNRHLQGEELSAVEQAYRTEPVMVECSEENTDHGNFTMVANDDGSVSFKTTSGRYVTAELDGTLTARANKQGQWEHFEHVHLGKGSAAFKSCHGKYIVAQSNGFLTASGRHKADAERFQVAERGGANRSFSLLTSRNRSISVVVHRLVDADTAKFRIESCTHGIALQSSDGKYWGVNRDHGGFVTFSNDHILDDACFNMGMYGNGKVCFESNTSKYLTANPDGSLQEADGNVEDSQLFQRIDHPDGTLSLLTSFGDFLDVTRMHLVHVPSLFCFSYTMTTGPEWDAIREQFERKLSIFACDSWAVYSIEKQKLGNGVQTTAIGGPPATVQHWNAVVILNTDVFLRAWDMIKRSRQWENAQWIVKVDVDTVFFPGRLRKHLRQKGNPWRTKSYFKNCQWYNSMQGPLEVYSHAATKAFFQEGWKCEQIGHDQFGEDIFMQKCMPLLDATPLEDWNLVADQYCRTMTNACECEAQNAWKPAFHPCKTSEQWLACYDVAAA